MPKSVPLTITVADFNETYWHRSALADFCRMKGLPSGGNKIALTNRIAAHLSGKTPLKLVSKRRAVMPTNFSLDTVIGENWYCSQPLRNFFQSQTSLKFTFNKALREFIANGAGQTLAQALQYWKNTKDAPTQTIDPQFEYNRFMRQYFSQNKGSDLSDAIHAWRIYRDTPKSQRNLSISC